MGRKRNSKLDSSQNIEKRDDSTTASVTNNAESTSNFDVYKNLTPEEQAQLNLITGGQTLDDVKSVDKNNEEILNKVIVKEKLT